MLSQKKSPDRPKSTKGFTLIELLLATFLIAVLSTLAFNGYFRSTNTFKFLEAHKSIVSSLRAARSYAITNREMNGIAPLNYGVYLSDGSTIFLAKIDDPNNCPAPRDNISGYCTFKNQSVNLADKGYTLVLKDSQDEAVTMPVFILYDWQSGELHVINADNVELSKEIDKFIYLELKDQKNDLTKYTVIFQATGLIEEHKNPIAL